MKSKGLSSVIGILLLLGIFTTTFSVYLTSVYPTLVANTELTMHNQMRNQILEIDSAIRESASEKINQTVKLSTNADYPYPKSLSLKLRYETKVQDSAGYEVSGLDSSETFLKQKSGSSVSYTSDRIIFEPKRSGPEYTPPNITVGQTSVTLNTQTGSSFLAEPLTVEDDIIKLYNIKSDLGSTRSLQVAHVKTKSINKTGVASSGNINISIQSDVSASQWTTSLSEELIGNGGNLVSVSQTNPSKVTLKLESGAYKIYQYNVTITDRLVSESPQPDDSRLLVAPNSERRQPSGVSYVTPTGELKRLTESRKIQDYQITSSQFSSIGNELTQSKKIPVIDSSGNLKLVSQSGTVQTIATDAEYNGVTTAVSKRGDKVLYISNDDNIKKAGKSSQTVEKEFSSNSNANPNTMVGYGDIDNDKKKEIIFGGSGPSGNSNTINYVDDDNSIRAAQNTQYGTNNQRAVGDARRVTTNLSKPEIVPVVDGSQTIKFVSSNELVGSVQNNISANKTTTQYFDSNQNDKLEVIFIGQNGYLKKIVDPLSDPQISFVRELSTGNRIKANPNYGLG